MRPRRSSTAPIPELMPLCAVLLGGGTQMNIRQSLPKSADPPDLDAKYRASLLVVEARLHRVQQTFDELVAKLAVVYRLSGNDDNDRKVHNPLVEFDKPSDVVKDTSLTQAEKKQALDTLEQDARQLLTASNEGM